MAPRKKVDALVVNQTNQIQSQPLNIAQPIAPPSLQDSAIVTQLQALTVEQSAQLGHVLADFNNAVVRGAVEYVSANGNDPRYRQNTNLLLEALRGSSVAVTQQFNESQNSVIAAMHNPSLVDQFFAPVADEVPQTEIAE